MDLADLKSDIAAYSHRNDLGSQLDGFIAKAYAQINDVMRLVDMETTATITDTLPSDWLETRSVQAAAPSGALVELPTVGRAELPRYGLTGAMPAAYAQYDGQIQQGPPLGADLTLIYYASVPVPTSENATDVYLTKYPDLLLDACLEQVGKYTQDIELARNSRDSWRAQAGLANANSRRSRLGSRTRAVRNYQAAQGAPST